MNLGVTQSALVCAPRFSVFWRARRSSSPDQEIVRNLVGKAVEIDVDTVAWIEADGRGSAPASRTSSGRRLRLRAGTRGDLPRSTAAVVRAKRLAEALSHPKGFKQQRGNVPGRLIGTILSDADYAGRR